MTGLQISEEQVDAAVDAMSQNYPAGGELRHLVRPNDLLPVDLWRDGFIAGWASRDRRDQEPLRLDTIVLLIGHGGNATTAKRKRDGWFCAEHWTPDGNSEHWPWPLLIARFESWEIVWEPAS